MLAIVVSFFSTRAAVYLYFLVVLFHYFPESLDPRLPGRSAQGRMSNSLRAFQ